MQDDHDLENGPAEGEYHFSDEGIYETSDEEAQSPEITEKTGLGASFTSYRRFIIIGGIFAGILLVVYLLVAPPTTPTSTEIVASNPAVTTMQQRAKMLAATSSAKKNEAPSAVKTQTVSSSAEKPAMLRKVAAHQVVTEKNTVESMTPRQTTPQTSTMEAPKPAVPAQQITTEAVRTVSPPPTQEAAAPSFAQAGAVNSHFSELTVAIPMQEQQLALSRSNKVIVDRLAALEEANTKMINQLNAEYAHRLANFETQDKALQEQVRSLTAKISGMEAKMDQLQQTINKQNQLPSSQENVNQINVSPNYGNTSTLTLPSSEATSSSHKANYAVQAIIPGRAWLRTEDGETVTVAEGDMLRGLGRVTKIDPYDGTIQIDTGSKMILLSYGNGDYS